MVDTKTIEDIMQQIINKYSPHRIILFGSQAKGTATKKSDIDLCIVKDTDNKRTLAVEMYMNIDSDKPFDLIIYTENEWNECAEDKTSFAHLIRKKGVEIYGR